MMGGPQPSESSRRTGREEAIETLIDMDPCGAAYRVARTMNGGLSSALQGRANRIPDSALFDAAHALSRYEITADSPEILDLYGNGRNSDDSTTANKEDKTDRAETEEAQVTPTKLRLKEGWQDRVIRHHDKIIRAKNNHANTIPAAAGTPPVAGGCATGNKLATANASSSNNAMPPPALISALRQIFGTVSSPDLQDLLSDKGGGGGGRSLDLEKEENNPKLSKDGVVNTLPSLLQAVLNHGIFAETSTPLSNNEGGSSNMKTPPPSGRLNIKRDWKHMFDISDTSAVRGGDSKDETEADTGNDDSVATSREGGNDDDNDGQGGVSEGADARVTTYLEAAGGKTPKKSNATQAEVKVPSAANLEVIVGNACKDVLHQSGSENARVHGLLIAALSVMTGCLLSEDDLEKLNLGEIQDNSAMQTTVHTSNTSVTLDSTNDATDPFASSLQVGALLTTLPKANGAEEVNEFVLDDTLLRYFAEASSMYEERIEIQKANLFKGQTPVPITPKGNKSSSSPSIASLLGSNPPPPHEPKVDTSDSDDTPDILPASAGSMPGLISRGRSEESGGESAGETAASILLGNLASIVANEIANADAIMDELDELPSSDDDDDDDEEDDEAAEMMAPLGNLHDDSDSEAAEMMGRLLGGVHDDSDSNDDDDSASENNNEVDEEANEVEVEDEEEAGDEENDEEENEDGEENDDEELQRALALSLAAAIGGEASSDSSNNSDDSNSTDGNSDATTSGSAAAAAEGVAASTDATASGVTRDATMTPPPPPIKVGSKVGQTSKQTGDSSHVLQQEDNLIPLPLLPSMPPFSLLPKHDGFAATSYEEEIEEASEEVKSSAEADSCAAIFEPSALSSFGKLPASHVLVHLLKAVMEMMQGNTEKSSHGDSDDVDDASSMERLSSFWTKNSSKKSNDGDGADEITESFTPDSTTSSLLIASLHLSSHLRNSALAVLNDLLANMEDRKCDGTIDGVIDEDNDDSDSQQSIKIANSAIETTEDVLPEKDDPAAGVAFGIAIASAAETSEYLETKGLKRKAAAAAQIATLRHKTKLKLVEMWRGRVEFYSACCLLNLRCLRMFMGKCLQHGLGFSDNQSSAVSISTKTRLGLLAILSNFYSSATSTSFVVLKASMGQFLSEKGDSLTSSVDELQDQFLVVSLCNESLFLWGAAIPFLYPDHKGRVEFLGSTLQSLSLDSCNLSTARRIKNCNWTDPELQTLKLDVFCKRLRVCDMLDGFVASPIVSTEAVEDDNTTRNGSPDNSISMISLLGAVLERSGGVKSNSDSNLAMFYLALCQRAISNLILWSDLSMSSNDVNDHDISGGEAGGGSGGSGSAYGDASLQVKANPSKLHFDSAKCADSISVALSSGQPSVTANQRATKVWGTVLSTTHFLPKSGIHRWAVKLDRCERGHVFVGVSTARANLKTYVGGDSNGWGLIGTQALWHDRNKIRGDYGSTFRTGAVVVVTLDTNVGTLSFGLWKDGTPNASDGGASGPLSPMALMASPRRGSAPGTGGPVIEDWGVAFEGLPLDVKLFPAVGLYQRDDRAILCTVSNSIAASSSGGKSSQPAISSGDIYFPLGKDHELQTTSDHLSLVRTWNQKLCSDGISFATEILSRSIQLLSSENAPQKADDLLLMEVLPSLASSICLIPSCIPTLSAQYAMELLPFMTRCAKLIDKMISPEDYKSFGPELKEGAWVVSVDSSEGDSKNCDKEYIVHLKQKAVQGNETGRSSYHGKSGNTASKHFAVIGVSFGTRVQFVEEWCSSSEVKEGEPFEGYAERSTSSYVIDARLSLDGTKFEGIRHNVSKGSVERITGHLRQPYSTAATVHSSVTQGDETCSISTKQWIQTESLLCLAVGHLSLILCSHTSLSDIDKDTKLPAESKAIFDSLLSTSPVLSRGRLDRDGIDVRNAIDSVWDRCRSAEIYTDIVEQWQDKVYFDLFDTSQTNDAMDMEEVRDIIEQHSSVMANQNGSLSRLCPKEYSEAQIRAACAIFYHACGSRSTDAKVQSDVASKALRASLQIMENGIREALADSSQSNLPRREVSEDRCLLTGLIAQLLFGLSCTPDIKDRSTDLIVDEVALVFKSIKSVADLKYIKQEMEVRTEKCIMRHVGLKSLHLLIETEGDSLGGIRVHSAIESALVSFPRLLQPASTGAMSEPDSDQGLAAHLTASIAGCVASVQTCVHSCISSLFEQIGLILATAANQDSTSLMLGLVANYFTVFHHTERHETILKMLPSLRNIVERCRDPALLSESKDADGSSSPETKLLDIVHKQESQRLLRTSASVLMTTCAQLSKDLDGSSDLIELLSEHLLHEISETIPHVAKNSQLARDLEEVEAVQSDWAIYKTSSGSKPQSKHSVTEKEAAHSPKGLAYLSTHGSLSMKPANPPPELPSVIYFSQLLNVLHVATTAPSFLESIKSKAGTLLSALGLQLTEKNEQYQQGIPLNKGLLLKFRRRILRLLRPILLSMKADFLVICQLFHMAGLVAEASHLSGASEIRSNDELLLVQGAVSLLRYLYTFSTPWRGAIHRSIADVLKGTRTSDSSSLASTIFCGVLAFLGGAPGTLRPGSFVIIDPEVASSSSASSAASSSAKSSRGGGGSGAAGGAASGAAIASTSGAEEIVSGLSRHNALSGVMSSVVDPRTGQCEVIILGNKSHMQLPPTGSESDGGSCLGPSRVTIRAVRVGSSNVSAADELPLFLPDNADLSSMDIFAPLVDLVKSVSSSIQEAGVVGKAEEPAEPLRAVHAGELMKCAMGLRSTAVLASEPGVLGNLLGNDDVKESGSDKSGGSFRSFLAHALQMASLRADAHHEGLSSLPALEARAHHLLAVRLAIRSRTNKLDATDSASLKALLEEEEKSPPLPTTTSPLTSSRDVDVPLKSSLRGKSHRTPPSSAVGTSSFFTSSRLSRQSSSSRATESASNLRRQDFDSSAAAAIAAERSASNNSNGSNNEDEENGNNADEDDAESAETAAAAAHLREAAIVQMAELGLPRQWAELALSRVGGTNIEAAVHFCLERGGDMERLLAEEAERGGAAGGAGGGSRASSAVSGGRRGGRFGASRLGSSANLIRQLVEMGFPRHWCVEALSATRNNVDEALTWILTNGDRLSAEDEAAADEGEEEEEEDGEDSEEEDDDNEDEEDDSAVVADDADDKGTRSEKIDADATPSTETAPDSSAEAKSSGWTDTVCPVRFVSGRSSIDPRTLSVTGLPNGGFSSVGTKGVLLTSGKWYYEAVVQTAGCLQIGWADASFAGHCQADRGDGCGDGPSSWAFDGWRRYRWHSNATEWGCRWEEGDVVGCLVDMDDMSVGFTLNGKGEEIGMGCAFSKEGFRPCGGVYACASFNRREKLRLVLGGEGTEPFNHAPPEGYRGLGEAIREATAERDVLLAEEKALVEPTTTTTTTLSAESDDNNDESSKSAETKHRYVCDFSDGEHGHELFAWQHRYYGSDASVHLGSSRPAGLFASGAGGAGGSKSSKGAGVGKAGDVVAADVASRLGRILATKKEEGSGEEGKASESVDEGKSAETTEGKEAPSSSSFESSISALRDAYGAIDKEADAELKEALVSLCGLYSQKLVVHVMVSRSNEFTLSCFLPRSISTPASSAEASSATETPKAEAARRLWRVIEHTTSLASSGWVGEAGAMAVAAEALGLGISAGDGRSAGAPAGMCSPAGGGTGGGNANASGSDNNGVLLLCGGTTQFLSAAVSPDAADVDRSDAAFSSTSLTFCACAERAVGSDAGGSPSFLRTGLQSAVGASAEFRGVLLAAVRKGVRLLAVVEYSSDEGGSEEDEPSEAPAERSKRESDAEAVGSAPDARLVSFLTGVLLSEPVRAELSLSLHASLLSSLFEGWCIGLLSASSPWRMVCAFTAAGILNACPGALQRAAGRIPIVARYLGRLESTVLRRTWAERAAVPVCSKYVQAMMELLTSVKRALRVCPDAVKCLPGFGAVRVDAATPLPFNPSCCSHSTGTTDEEEKTLSPSECNSWECNEGWIVSDAGWEIWTGRVVIMEPSEWKPPPRSIVRTLMDGGEGPPLLREGCTVMRGVDWGTNEENENEDGKDLYEKDKAQKEEARRMEEEEEERKKVSEQLEDNEQPTETDNATAADTESPVDPASEEDPSGDSPATVPAMQEDESSAEEKKADAKSVKKKKKKKAISSKLPLGTVLSIEPWNGQPAMARRIRWHLSGEEGIYRYGGDGGRFDIVHVEVNEKETRVKKKHPPPETREQCAVRYGFGKRRTLNVLLRLRNCPLRNGILGSGNDSNEDDEGEKCDGILEYPDFGAGIRVECTFYPDGAISITEREVLYGTKDSGWDARFGQPTFVPDTVMVVSPTHSDDSLAEYDELLGSSSFIVKELRNKEDGGRLRVTSEMRLLRSKQSAVVAAESNQLTSVPANLSSSQPPPICFDSSYHASSMSLSKDSRTVTCVTSDGRGVAYGNVGFTKGVHYWEVKLEKAEIGSVYIGIAEKPSGNNGGSGSGGGGLGFDGQPRLNRWLGWGFVNFRATYTAGAERVYGAHCHAGDTIGVLLDCDAGRVNYFIDGVKYGEHILNDLGCAFENVSPFGFNADGCGSGGAGQGAPSGIDGGRNGRYPANGAVRPKALWPVIGLRHPGDRVTMSSKWMTSQGVDGTSVVRNALAVDEILCAYEKPHLSISNPKEARLEDCRISLPQWFVEESFQEYTRWKSARWHRTSTRGSGPCKLSSYGLDVDLDTSPLVCAAACASIGLPVAMLPGDRVDIKRSAGRILELQEEAVIVGAYQGRLFYRLVSQKSEGGSLMEGGGRAWFWDESEAVSGGLQLIGEGLGRGVKLPKLSRFNPSNGGLKVVYGGGAVVRSDLEIFDGSRSIGTIPSGTIIPPKDVIERRLNSCGVVRYLIDHEPIGRGWVSSRIRGGKEELIVEMLPLEEESENTQDQRQYTTPEDSAREWYTQYKKSTQTSEDTSGRDDAFFKTLNIKNLQEFEQSLMGGIIYGMSEQNSDALVAATYGRIADALPHSSEGGCSFLDCALVLGAHQPHNQRLLLRGPSGSIDASVYEVATESLVHVIGKLPSTKALMARISMLRAFNRRARFGLPWLPLRSAQEGSAILGGLSGFGTSLERAGRTWDSKSKTLWVQAPSISSRLRNCREILFTSTKRFFLDSVMDATTTPTPLSHDEYELPREVRTVRVNRLKARRAMASDDSALKKKHCVISQLQREMRGWSGATLRRGFVAKGHGGQKRAFKVKLVGEGVNDYSGPYREVFTDAMLEVTDLDPSGNSSLGVLQPSANNQASVGEGRDLFVLASAPNDSNLPERSNSKLLSCEERDLLNSFSSLTHKKNESSREIEEALSYLGKLVGTACRHGIPVDLPLPLGVVWKRLTEEVISVEDIMKEIDILALRSAQDEDYHQSAASSLDCALATQRRLLNSFTEGMCSVLPVELLPMFTGEQLRDIICGNPDIDVELLRRVVEYEGYQETDTVVAYFWEVLREMTTSERKLFLQFVWARNRLPLKESDFDAPFKIQKDMKTVNEDGDYPLPSASTCFFSLTLPDYPKKEVLKQKLLFAIENVTTMESDYVTNDVEVSEGWRGL